MAKRIKTLFFSTVPLLLTLGLQLVIQLYLILIAGFFLLVIAPIISEEIYEFEFHINFIMSDMNFMQVFYLVYSFCCIIIFGTWYQKRCGGKLQIQIKKEIHPLELLGIVFLTPGSQYLTSILAGFISLVFPSWLEEYQNLLETAGIDQNMTFLMFLYSVILAPISEELIFRGVTYKIARRVFPFWFANFIQALLFGVFHMNMLQGCYTFIFGLFLGYICEKGGTIYHVIFFHFLFNLWGTIISSFLIVENALLQGIIIIAGTIAGLFLGLFFFHKGNRQKRFSGQSAL